MSETITIYCKNNNTYKEVPIGSSLLDIYSLVGAPLRLRPMNAQVNNKTEGLTFRCWHPKMVEYVTIPDFQGCRTICPFPLSYFLESSERCTPFGNSEPGTSHLERLLLRYPTTAKT